MTEPDATEANSLRERVPWRRIVRILGLALLVAIVLPFVVYSVPQVVGAEHSYVVLSGSMSPTIDAGGIIIVDSVGASAINEGDVITFQRPGDERPTTHRVVDVVQQDGQAAFQTKGDGNPNVDRELVTASQVEGRVMSVGGLLFTVPLAGYVIEFASTQMGFLALFVVPVALLVALEIRDVVGAATASADRGDEAADPTGRGADAGSTTVASDGGATAPDAAGDESSEDGIAFRAAELQLGLLVLGAFLAYSVWVAYATRDVWAFGVAGSVGTTFLLLAGLYVVGGRSTGTAGGADDRTDPDGGSPEPDGEPGTSTDTDAAEALEKADEADDDAGSLLDPLDADDARSTGKFADGPPASTVNGTDVQSGGEPSRSESDD